MILRSNFKLLYSMPPSSSRSWDDKLWNMELRPMVTSRESCGKSPAAIVGAVARRSLRGSRPPPITNMDEATVATRSIERASLIRRPALRRRRRLLPGVEYVRVIVSISSSEEVVSLGIQVLVKLLYHLYRPRLSRLALPVAFLRKVSNWHNKLVHCSLPRSRSRGPGI